MHAPVIEVGDLKANRGEGTNPALRVQIEQEDDRMRMDPNRARVSFLFLELELGLNFVGTARITQDAAAERSVELAKRACETVDLFRNDVEMTPVESIQLDLMRKQLGREIEGTVEMLFAS